MRIHNSVYLWYAYTCICPWSSVQTYDYPMAQASRYSLPWEDGWGNQEFTETKSVDSYVLHSQESGPYHLYINAIHIRWHPLTSCVYLRWHTATFTNIRWQPLRSTNHRQLSPKTRAWPSTCSERVCPATSLTKSRMVTGPTPGRAQATEPTDGHKGTP